MNEVFEIPLTGPRSLREEVANSITHGMGLVASVVGAIVLMSAAIAGGDRWTIAGCLVYSLSMVLVYLASTLSHVYQRPSRKRLFRKLDQAFIYLLIAGAYTPWGLVYLREGWTLLTFFAIWAVALGGFLSKTLFAHRVESVALWVYLALGWLPIFSIGAILERVPHAGLRWMAAGGACYTIGVVFLALDERVPYFHAIWHKWVNAGTVCQWLAVWWYVVG